MCLRRIDRIVGSGSLDGPASCDGLDPPVSQARRIVGSNRGVSSTLAVGLTEIYNIRHGPH